MKTHLLPNLLTVIRILLIPAILRCFLKEQFYLATFLFSLAAATDGLDGYLARQLKQTSPLGAWLDPVADKLIVVSTTILLLCDNQFNSLGISAIIATGREIAISAFREWMAILGQHNAVAVSALGKLKTVIQMSAIFICLLSKAHVAWPWLVLAGHSLFHLGTLLSLVSLVQYIRSAGED